MRQRLLKPVASCQNLLHRKIILACALVCVPMIAFTITIICIVFIHQVDLNYCPSPNLCYKPHAGVKAESSDYYVDFPVGRLAFVSSLSSTISFTLVAALMMIYGYVAAHQLFGKSCSTDEHGTLPSPYEFTVIIRLLNAEVFVLWAMRDRLLSNLFGWRYTRRQAKSLESPLLRQSLLVFFFALFSRCVNQNRL